MMSGKSFELNTRQPEPMALAANDKEKPHLIEKRRITDYQDVPGAVTAPEDADMRQFVSFSVGEQDFCVDIMAVREIRTWTKVTSLPNSPKYIRGVINLRGVIVPVIDLRMRLDQGLTEPTPGHVVVIVAINGMQNGLLVDGVSDIITVHPREIVPIPEPEGQKRNPYFDGLITGQEKLMALVALEQLILQQPEEQQTSAA
jgi:purine-binding chemotaxis protein CheW